MGRALDRALLKHEVMPDVGGDSIVESGSNTDGEWTRWADGTQICSWLYNGNALTSGAGDDALWNYPSSFIASPNLTIGSGVSTSSNIDAGTGIAVGFPGYTSNNFTQVRFMAQNEYTGDIGGYGVYLSAYGRWK